MQVTYFQRKPRPTGNYSLEAIFADVRARLPAVDSRLHIAPCFSNGLLRRLAIMVDAYAHQGQINHVTGDINFAAIFLNHRKTVLTVLDCFGVEERRGLNGKLFRKLWIEWPVYRSRLVTTISQASKQDIVRLTGCSPDKVVVIGVAISPGFQPVDKPFCSDYPRILQVGTSPNKNIERLAQALQGIPCKLVVVGRLTPGAVHRNRTGSPRL